VRFVYRMDGNVAATIDSIGRVTLGQGAGAIVGVIRGETEVFGDEAGAELLGRIDSDRRVWDARHEFVGSVDASGRVLDMTGRMVGSAHEAIDGAALLLLVGSLDPQAVAPPPPPPEALSTMMDEVIALADENEKAGPGIRKNVKPLTDEEIFGKPFKKT